VEIEEGSIISTDTPELIFFKNEESRRLERLVATLPEEERIIILLRYVNELSYDEISELVDASVSTVRNKLHRAKKKMREIVQREGGNFREVSNDR
jgi:RNA polymerase sigma factor (sigma-70 family)